MTKKGNCGIIVKNAYKEASIFLNEKMTVYSLREFDEKPLFNKYAQDLGFEIVPCSDMPTVENACLAKGCRYVNIITTPVDRKLLETFKALRVEYLVTRTIGYDHIDISAAKELGIKVANTPYSPDGVAEYTVMLMLMCIRNIKSVTGRFAVQDYTLKGLMGNELSSMTIGIIGTGRIGTRLARILSGFGCRVIAHSSSVNKSAANYVEYVPLEQLYRESDIISLHIPASEDTVHMINNDAISKMKDGVVIINTARGTLIDSKALTAGLDSGKIGGAGLDVVEDEHSLFYYDLRGQVIKNSSMYQLSSYPNVIITHHMAFYTRQAVETMVHDSLRGAFFHANSQDNPWLVSD